MPKDVRDLFEKNIKIKTLEVAQGLCMLYNDGKKTLKSADHVIEQIYKCTHASLGNCPNEHKDWIESINELHANLVRGRYINDE